MTTTGKAHYKTTGPEIWNDKGTVTHFVSAMGTTGTIITSTYLKEKTSHTNNRSTTQ
jgi:cysteine synthase B